MAKDYTIMSQEQIINDIKDMASEAIQNLKKANELIGNIAVTCRIYKIPNSEQLHNYQNFHEMFSIQMKKLGTFLYNNE